MVREADRVLTGEGQLIVLGFRPVEPLGPARGGVAAAGSRRACSRCCGTAACATGCGCWAMKSCCAALSVQPAAEPGGAGDAPGRILRRGLFNPLPAGA